jgi:uncharacterized protein (DUF302 family)
MFRFAFIALSVGLLIPSAHAADGEVALVSPYSAKATLDRLESIAQSRGLKIFARIDHAAGAQSVDLPLRPTELLIFGHPKGGTPLMQCAQTYGIDLPLRVLAWEDAAGKTWLGYKLPSGLVVNHPQATCETELKRLSATLDILTKEAVKE